MGFKREIGRVALGLAVLAAAAAAEAAPGEPLIVTRLPENDLQVAVLKDPEATSADEEAQQFARVIMQAAAADRQANAARCKSSDPVPSAGAERLAWEANCRYRRR